MSWISDIFLKPKAYEFAIFFDLRLNKRLSKQSYGWWFKTIFDVIVMGMRLV